MFKIVSTIFVDENSNIQLMNVTVKNANSGLAIRGSTVTAHNIKTVGNIFAGIYLLNGTLTITGTPSHTGYPGAVAIAAASTAIVNSSLYEEIEELEGSNGTVYLESFVLKGTKPLFVSEIISFVAWNDQSAIEIIRSIYNALTPAEKSQVTNIALLEQNEQKLVDDRAGKIGPTYQPPVASIGTISLPTVYSGFTISVHSSSDENIYDKYGKILANGSSTVVYTVTHDMSGKTANTKPAMVNVTITQAPIVPFASIIGEAKVGKTVKGFYGYFDHEGDIEGISTFKWYRADDATGANKTEISGETSITYTLTIDDLGKYIFFEVTPVANTGQTIGVPTLSLPMATAVVNNLLLDEQVEEDSSVQNGELTTATIS